MTKVFLGIAQFSSLDSQNKSSNSILNKYSVKGTN
jgi:hypothetical protein